MIGNTLFGVGMAMLAAVFIAMEAPKDLQLPMGIGLILVAQFAIKHKIEELEERIIKWKEETSDSDSKK